MQINLSMVPKRYLLGGGLSGKSLTDHYQPGRSPGARGHSELGTARSPTEIHP